MLKSFMIKAKHPFTIIVVSIVVFLFTLLVLFLLVIRSECVEGAHWVYVPLVSVDRGRSRQTFVDAMVDSIVFIPQYFCLFYWFDFFVSSIKLNKIITKGRFTHWISKFHFIF